MAVYATDLDFETAPTFRRFQTVNARQAQAAGTASFLDEQHIEPDLDEEFDDEPDIRADQTVEVEAGDWIVTDDAGIRRVSDDVFGQTFEGLGGAGAHGGVFEEYGDVVKAVRLTEPDTVYYPDGTVVEAQANDAVLQAADGTLSHQDGRDFVGRFARCGSNGTVMCQQRGFLQDQAKTLVQLRGQEGADTVEQHIRDLKRMSDACLNHARHQQAQRLQEDAEYELDEAGQPEIEEPEADGGNRRLMSDVYLMGLTLNRAGYDDVISDEEAQRYARNDLRALPQGDEDAALAAPSQLPTRLSQAVAVVDDGLADTVGNRLTPIKSAPTYTQNAIRSFARNIFDRYASVPMEEVQMMGEPSHDPENDVRRLYAYVQENGRQKQGRQTIDCSEVMPGAGAAGGYTADVEVWTTDEQDFMFVSDFMGEYVYSWPAQAPALTYVEANRLETPAADHNHGFDNEPEEDDTLPPTMPM